MQVNISKSKKALTREEWQKLENTLNVKFPNDYRQFMSLHNGGRPKPSDFRITWKNQNIAQGWKISMVGDFFAVYDGGAVNLLHSAKQYIDRIPNGMIPIANDPSGNLILLGTSDKNNGKVFFWLHDLEEEYDASDIENLGFIANSFSEFIDSLFES